MEYENKFFSKNSEKSFKILRQKHLSKDQSNYNSKSNLAKSTQNLGLNTISTGVEAPQNLKLEFENLTIDSELNINKLKKSKLTKDAENYYKIPTF